MATASSAHTARPMQEGRTGRVALLEMLMNEIPDGIPTYGRKVMALKKLETGMQVQFADGKTEDADLVVAADGLYSVGPLAIQKNIISNSWIRESENNMFQTTRSRTGDKSRTGITSLMGWSLISKLSRLIRLCGKRTVTLFSYRG